MSVEAELPTLGDPRCFPRGERKIDRRSDHEITRGAVRAEHQAKQQADAGEQRQEAQEAVSSLFSMQLNKNCTNLLAMVGLVASRRQGA